MISNVQAGLLVANQTLNGDGAKIQKESRSDKSEKTEKSAELSKVDSIKEAVANNTYAINVPAVSQKMADALLEGSLQA